MTRAARALGIMGLASYSVGWLAIVILPAVLYFATYFFALSATSFLMSGAVRAR